VKKIKIIVLIFIAVLLGIAFFILFFDEAVLVRMGTFYKAKVTEKVVALTFDDGPSLVWTPQILNELKRSGIKATFFMLGKHVEEYPDIARRVVGEGHEVGIHSYDHKNYIFYTKYDVKNELEYTRKIIKDITGKETNLFRPPKSWLSKREKKKIKEFGFEVVLWSLNSKDWVNFDEKYIVSYLVKNIRPGDIILFHDAGGVWGIEKGDRSETVKTIFPLSEKLREKEYRFVTVGELLELQKRNDAKQ
jgi:peptidoglycan/xylan/chitin deacetylase (PgdA/CDA1 family)